MVLINHLSGTCSPDPAFKKTRIESLFILFYMYIRGIHETNIVFLIIQIPVRSQLDLPIS